MDMVLYSILNNKIKQVGAPSEDVIKECLDNYLVDHPIGEDEINATVDAAMANLHKEIITVEEGDDISIPSKQEFDNLKQELDDLRQEFNSLKQTLNIN